MKLEAVNKQCPEKIGLATIVIVEGDQVRIEFDGYKGTGYWCYYADRDLFPAGWCARTGHPLQSPGLVYFIYISVGYVCACVSYILRKWTIQICSQFTGNVNGLRSNKIW